MSDLLRELHRELRRLSGEAPFALTLLFTLSLGVAAVTAMFSLVQATLLRSLPYTAPERLALIWETHPEQADDWRVASLPNFVDWRRESRSFESMALVELWRPVLTGDDEPRRLSGARVSDSFFEMLGVEPALGRLFTADELRSGGEPVVLLDHGLWQRRFGGDPAIVGRRVELDGEPATVIGVLRRGFTVPEPAVFEPAEIWTPRPLDSERAGRGNRYFRVIGRLAPGTSLDRARAELKTVAAELAAAWPESNADWGIAASSLREQVVAGYRLQLLVLSLVVGLGFLVALANLTNLFLARTASRHGELAVALALGAGRWRLTAKLLTSGVVLTALGGGIGYVLGRSLTHPLAVWVLRRAPSDVGGDLTAVLCALALVVLTLATLSVVTFGYVSRIDVQAGLQTSARSGSRRGRCRWLITAEVGTALFLLTLAGLMLESFRHLTRIDPGFDAAGVVTLQLEAPRDVAQTLGDRLPGIFDELRERITALPQISGAAFIHQLPLAGASMSTRAYPSADTTTREPVQVELRGVSADYFTTMGIPLISGRDFLPSDLLASKPGSSSGRHGVVLSVAAAERLWPGQEALDRELILDWGPPVPRRVIALVGDVKHDGLRRRAAPEAYVPFPQAPHRALFLVARSRGEETIALRALTAEVRRARPDLVIEKARTLSDVVAAETADTRSLAVLLGAFAAASLTLAAIGIYGLIAFLVVRRRRDFGIRLALGARQGDLIALAMREGLRRALLGMALGLLAALLGARLISGLLVEVEPYDLTTLFWMSGLLLATVLVASYVPARHLARVDLAKTLKSL